MKKIIVFFGISIAALLSPFAVSAHLFGQPPFFKVNGQYAQLYPVPVSSLYNFDLPQDLPPTNYLVNQSINFELDKNRLPAPPETIAKTKFDWDFTDGEHAQGLKVTHAFTKIGSYIMKIYADDGTTPKPQMIESALINVLPDKNYQLPKAVISVNGKQSKDPLTDILHFNLHDNLQFECSGGISCFWDFGDQTSAYGKTQTHKYATNLSQVFVVLRVKNADGFIADNFVEIKNDTGAKNNVSTPSKTEPSQQLGKSNQLPITIGVIIAFIILALTVRQFVRGRHREKH